MIDIPFLLEFGLLNLALFTAGYIGKVFKLPTAIFYIIIGILLGKFIHEDETIERFSELGIVLLFFYLGLEFNIVRAVSTAKRIWTVGLLDIFFNFFVIFAVLKLMGFSWLISFLGGAVAYASSSAITTKVIADNKRIANPETEMILGLMVFEDIVAPIMLAVLAGIMTGGELTPVMFGIMAFKIIAVFSMVYLIVMLFRDKLSNFIDKFINEDLFILFAFGGLIVFAGFTQAIGLSEAIGAFLMGMIISETGKSHDVEKSMFSIKELAVAIFFFLFGANIVIDKSLLDIKSIVMIFVIVVLSMIGKFLTGYIGGKFYGLSKRASMTAGFSIINRGEFSIVISKLSPANFSPFFGVYILIMAITGILFAQYAPKISKFLVKPQKPAL
ncbi:MAG: cation:proton antiporter [Hydrogenothermaceae bacterium]|nr:cation:proton antiporter [Hydrogenothermaceae bacterium]